MSSAPTIDVAGTETPACGSPSGVVDGTVVTAGAAAAAAASEQDGAAAAAAASEPDGAAAALARATAYTLSIQQPEGFWEGEMVWNVMILSQYVILRAVTGRDFDARTRAGIVRHFTVTRNADGGWGMHPASPSYVFFTALAYVALRLLGVPPEDPLVARARLWLHQQPGGVRAIPSWGKYWLAFLGLYGYEGVNPCPPELFLLPERLPLHPRNYYCHTRRIYLGLSYLYGSRFVAATPLTEALRRELYDTPYAWIDFAAWRHRIAASDLFAPIGPGLRLAYDVLDRYERRPIAALRRRALDYCFDRIVDEQEATSHIAISPVNGILNCLALYARGLAAGQEHPLLARGLEGVEAWRWDDEIVGIRHAGGRTHTWDTSFVIQAALSSESAAAPAAEALRHGYRYLLGTQTLDEPAARAVHNDRDPSPGGWGLADGRHGWVVSDCTAEAVSALVALDRSPFAPPPGERIEPRRLTMAAEFILLRQNDDGGFGSYERPRGGGFLDAVNPTEMYGACMTERSYIECAGSCLAALADLRAHQPGVLTGSLARRADRAIARAVGFLRRSQRGDGVWPGFWGIWGTYGTFHAVKGLRAAGVPTNDPALQAGASWLVAHQKDDGGWGEHYRSCLEDRYVEHPESQATMTAWAVLTLLETNGPRAPSVERGIAWLRAHQAPDGSWPIEAPNGVFFGAAMLDYRLYRIYFPLWALARYQALR